MNRMIASAAWLLSCCASALAMATETITIGGSGGPTLALAPVAEAFHRANPAVRVTLEPSLGTRGGIRGVAQGSIAIGVAARELTPQDPPLEGFEFARSPLVFAVGAGSSHSEVTMPQVAAMYAGQATTWPDGSRVRVILRPASDTDTLALRAHSPLLREASLAADARPGMLMAMTDLDSTEQIEAIAGAIGTTTLSQVLVEKRRIKPLRLDGVEPSVENLRDGRYPLHKKFVLIVRPPMSPAVRSFVAFVRGAEGRRILEQNGNWVAARPGD
jgi:phosphate transport system substrate-binding protein